MCVYKGLHDHLIWLTEIYTSNGKKDLSYTNGDNIILLY